MVRVYYNRDNFERLKTRAQELGSRERVYRHPNCAGLCYSSAVSNVSRLLGHARLMN